VAWQVQEAERRLSRVPELEQNEGPQIVTRQGRDVAVVLSLGDHRALGGGTLAEDLRGLADRRPRAARGGDRGGRRRSRAFASARRRDPARHRGRSGRVIPSPQELSTPASRSWSGALAPPDWRRCRDRGTVGSYLSRSGARPAIDGLIAATAIEHGLAVVTRNERDLARLGVPVVNPRSGP
jgi:hypothetical protein